MQSLYSFLQNRDGNLTEEVTFFKKSYLNTFSLYLTLLAFLKSVHEHAIDQMHLQKELRSDAVPDNIAKLVENKILKFIAQHPVLVNYIKKRKIKFWDLDFDYVKINFKALMHSESFKSYADKKSPTLEEDRSIVCF